MMMARSISQRVLTFVVSLASTTAHLAQQCNRVTQSYEYSVVGAGPAGLQLGHFLHKAKHDFVILERSKVLVKHLYVWKNAGRPGGVPMAS